MWVGVLIRGVGLDLGDETQHPVQAEGSTPALALAGTSCVVAKHAARAASCITAVARLRTGK